MTTPEIDTGPSRDGLSRRTLIKGAAVAGAAAWTAPVLVDSLSSPAAAAACSAAPTVTLATAVVKRESSGVTVTSLSTGSFTSAAGSRLVVFVATSNDAGANNSSTITSISGSVISSAAALGTQRADYGNETGRTHDLFCWSGTGGGTSALTVNFSATNAPQSISIGVFQVVGATVLTSAVSAAPLQTGTGLSTANYGAAPPANNREIWGAAGQDGSNTAIAITEPGTWTTSPGWEDMNTGGGNSRSFIFHGAYRAAPVNASGSFTAARTVNWAAIRVLCGC
ncbi:MAG: twin-arginine translocation signal domain-containing protein [Acidimicrobiia bacterium]